MRLIKILPVAAALFLLSCGEEQAAEEEQKADVVQESKGEQLFNNYCVQCHDVDEDIIGPKLRGALARWDNDTARIAAFIKNAGATIKSGDPRAVQVAEEWNHALMTPMPHLSDADINAILEYIAK